MPTSPDAQARLNAVGEEICATCGEPLDVQPGVTFIASTDGRVWHYGCAPSRTPDAQPSSTEEDGLILLMLAELHANVPEADRPMSMSDLSDEQTERARKAVRRVLVASMLSKPDGHFASIGELERHPSSTEGEVERSDEWAEKLKELHGWTGSAFLAGETHPTDAAVKAELYSFLCSLIGYLVTGEEIARAAIAAQVTK